MKPSFHMIIIILLVVFGTSSCTSQNGKSVKANKKKAKKADGINIDEYLVSAPTRKSETEIIKLYMPGERKSSNWHDYYDASGNATRVGDYPSAVFLLDKAIELNPKNSDCFYMRGRDKFMDLDDKNASAKLDFIEAIKLGCTNPGAFELLASIYDSDGETQKAIETLSKGIKLCEKKKHLYLARAALYATVGKKEKALADYSSLLESDPGFSRAYFMRGQLYEDLGKNEKALEEYNQAAKTNTIYNKVSTKIAGLKTRAILLNKLGRFEEATADLTEILKERPNDDELLRLRGDNFCALKKYDQALSDYTNSINAAPDFARLSYAARAKLYRLQGKNNLAEKDLVKSIKLKEAPAETPLYSGKPKKTE